MASKPVDLCPNRDLLNPNFSGYKLSLDKAPSVTHTLTQSLRPRVTAEDQFSFLHTKTFGQSANLLVQHDADPDRVYLLQPEDGAIFRVCYYDGKVDLASVFSFPAGGSEPKDGDYNPSVAFGNAGVAVASDGRGMLYILKTGTACDDVEPKWTSVFHEETLGKDRPFLVSHAAVKVVEEKTHLHVLLQYVAERKDIDEASESSEFCTAVEWMSYVQAADTWSLDRARRFAFNGSLDFLQLSEDACQLYACTEKDFSLVYDSQGMLPAVDELPKDQATPEVKRRPKFYYKQDVEDIVVWVVLPADTGKRDLSVTLKPRELSVAVKGEPVVAGELHHIVQSDSLTWTIAKGRLEIIMSKAAEGRIWTAFYATDGAGEEKLAEEINNPLHIDEIEAEFDSAEGENQAKGPQEGVFNSEQLEECDAMPETEFALHVFDGSKNEKSMSTSLQGHQFLFVSKGEDGRDRLCLRHDVDGLRWRAQPEAVQHEATFPALGYVQASKSSRKFTVASPDASYAAICDRSRHVYVYRQPSAIAKECALRNRKSGERVTEVAKQQVITLEAASEELVGAVATRTVLLLATEKSVTAIKINA